MSESRSAVIQKLVKVAKKNYPVVKPPSDRNVLDTIIYACLLEDSDFQAADEAFAKLEQYADWNEVRVSTVAELAEVMSGMTYPDKAADRLKHVLHSIFETHYSFDLDFLVKESQGKAVAQIEKYFGATPFTVGYVVQNSLDGHKIPISESILELAHALGLVTPKERENKTIPGIDRAVPKSKGPELFSTVHQFAVAYAKTPFSTEVRKLIVDIAPDANERLKKRASKSSSKSSATATHKGGKSAKGRKTSGKPAKKSAESSTAKSAAAGKKKTTKASPTKKSATSRKKTTKKPAKTAKATTKKTTKKKTTKKSATKSAKKTSRKASSKLSKKKPR